MDSIKDFYKKVTSTKVSRMWLGVVFSVFIIGLGIGGYFVYDNYYNDSEKETNEKKEDEGLLSLLPKTDCSLYKGDTEAVVSAVEAGDVLICSCVNGEEAKKKCEEQAMDSSYKKQAVSQCDPSICEGISSDVAREACKAGVQNYVDTLDADVLAACTMNAGDYKRSASNYERLLLEDPDNIETILSLSVAYANQALLDNDDVLYSKALSLLDDALNSKGEARIYRTRGLVYDMKGDFDKALVDFDKAIEISNNYYLAYVGRSHVYSQQGATKDAIDDLLYVYENDSERSEETAYAHLCRAALSPEFEDIWDKAIESCKIAIGSETILLDEKVATYGLLAKYMFYLGEEEKSLDYLQKAESLQPTNPVLLGQIANHYFAAKEYEEARDYGLRAVEQDSNISSSNYTLSKIYLNGFNDYNNAEKYALKAEESLSADPSILDSNRTVLGRSIYELLVDIYEKNGDKDKKNKYEDKLK